MQRLGSVLLVTVIALSGCGAGDDDVIVVDAWSRASAPMQTSGAAYFQLTVADDDTLLGASVPASIATAAELHEVVTVDDSSDGSHEMSTDADTNTDTDMNTDMHTDMGEDGRLAMMQELTDGLALTGGEPVSFEPGGYHVMLRELTEPLEVGDEFELTLEFASADDITVTVEVAETAP